MYVSHFSAYPPYETIPQYNTSNPCWNETFNTLDLPYDEVRATDFLSILSIDVNNTIIDINKL